MTELRRVTGPPSRLERHPGAIATLVIAGLVLVLVKPWGPLGAAPPTATHPWPSSSQSPVPDASRPPFVYDIRRSGMDEPPPSWELWPAGTLASFTFAMRIALTPDVSGEPASSVDPGGSAVPPPSPTPAPSHPGSSEPPETWPTVRIPAGNELDLLGINRPLGYSVAVKGLVRIADDGSRIGVPVVEAPSPWPDHFTIVGITLDPAVGAMAPWPDGRYLLFVVIEPGTLARTIEIIVEPRPADASPSPSDGARD